MRAQVERVEVVGLDEAYLDVSDLYSPRAAMRRLVHEIREATGIVCSVGIGPNKLVAKVASDAEKPAGFVVLSREQACARFGGSPPGLVPGIGPKTAARLAQLGLSTLAALAAAPEAALVERFGPNLGRELRRRARFEHEGVVGAARKVVSESRERTFDRDLRDPAQLSALLEQMSAELCASLAAHGRSGRTIGIKVRLDDFTTVTRAHTLAEPTATHGWSTRSRNGCCVSTHRRARSGCWACASPASASRGLTLTRMTRATRRPRPRTSWRCLCDQAQSTKR